MFPRISLSMVLALATASTPAVAGTALEARINAEPMPHVKLGGAQETVHYTRMRYHRDPTMVAKMLRHMQDMTESCVKNNKQMGKPINLPKSYPDLTIEVTSDTYWAANRAIQYDRGYIVNVDTKDCSLQEIEHYVIRLASSKGTCVIDPPMGITEGMCDSDQHAAAPADPALRNALASEGPLTSVPGLDPSNPQAAAVLAQVRKAMGNGGPSGPKKTIRGFECQVRVIAGITQCLTMAGKFVPPAMFGNSHNTGLLLESIQPQAWIARAEEVKFDTKVSAAVFAPPAVGKRGKAAK